MSKSGVFELISSDLFRYTGNVSIKSLLKEYVKNRGFKYSFWFRSTQAKSISIRLIAFFMHKRLTKRYGIQIPRQTKIGYGLYLGHHMCIVINQTAVIGNNCNLSQFTTIGSNDGQAATIGNNVYIGPNVCIIENVSIGDNSTIGAGAVVVKDVPANSTVAGNPAEVISYKTAGRFILNKWLSNTVNNE